LAKFIENYDHNIFLNAIFSLNIGESRLKLQPYIILTPDDRGFGSEVIEVISVSVVGTERSRV
jgi:hypothetical protein